MMKIHHNKLKKRGWTDEEIQHAHGVIQKAHKKKHGAYKFLEVATFWGMLVLALLGVLAVGIVLVPVLIMLNTLTVIAILSLLGLSLGGLFSVVFQDIEWLETSHHIATILLLGIITIFPTWLLVAKMNALTIAYNLQQPHNPWLISGIFTLALLLPYLLHLANIEWHTLGRKQHA
jgi:hypothetical protein